MYPSWSCFNSLLLEIFSLQVIHQIDSSLVFISLLYYIAFFFLSHCPSIIIIIVTTIKISTLYILYIYLNLLCGIYIKVIMSTFSILSQYPLTLFCQTLCHRPHIMLPHFSINKLSLT